MHRLQHALIVLRDLRRCKRDVMVLRGCQPNEVEALAHIADAIKNIQDAQKLLPPEIEDEALKGFDSYSLITEALQRLDMQELRGEPRRGPRPTR